MLPAADPWRGGLRRISASRFMTKISSRQLLLHPAIPRKIFYSRAGRFVTNLLNPVTYQSSSDNIFYAQKQVILTLAQKPCIIIGRCANVILKDAGVDCFRVFLYADEEHRWSRAEEIAENGDADLKRYLSKRDSMRETYYKTYTGHDFGDVHDYDICLDTGKLGYERCISVLTQIIEGLAAK